VFYGDQINTSHSELKAAHNEPNLLFVTIKAINIFRNRAIYSFLGGEIINSVQAVLIKTAPTQ